MGADDLDKAAERRTGPSTLTRSTERLPVQKGTSFQPLRAGKIVQVDIALYPSSMFFKAGESIRLVISSRKIIKTPPYFKRVSQRGTHVFHTGGEHESYLLVPEEVRADSRSRSES